MEIIIETTLIIEVAMQILEEEALKAEEIVPIIMPEIVAHTMEKEVIILKEEEVRATVTNTILLEVQHQEMKATHPEVEIIIHQDVHQPEAKAAHRETIIIVRQDLHQVVEIHHQVAVEVAVGAEVNLEVEFI